RSAVAMNSEATQMGPRASRPPSQKPKGGRGPSDTQPFSDLARSLAGQLRAVTLFGAPEGHDAATIGSLVEGGAAEAWLHVCRDDGRMARFAAALGFFHPHLTQLTFPAWDCLPYDRVSPNGEITSRRIDTLTRLAGGEEKRPLVVLTTVNALIQRVPPRRL